MISVHCQVSSSVIIIMQSDLTYPHTSVIDEIADKVRELDK